MSSLAIVGGSGFASLPGLIVEESVRVSTPFGETSAPVSRGRLGDQRVLFLPRHGAGHHLPPHRINYRANLWALRDVGARRVVGLAAVGGIGARFGPLTLAIPHDLIDYTYGREQSVFDGGSSGVEHVDMTSPYCDDLRDALARACASANCNAVSEGVYGATQGPRLETAAEIRRLERDGCDLVGMTGMPEAGIARELGLCYACLAFVVNWAAGKGAGAITMTEIEANLAESVGRVGHVLACLAHDHSL
jgi:5'-methylthioadenosine phosphorylase/5'-methylthioinosine phosphorylase